MSCLRFCLKERSYKALIESYADIIISCGSSTAACNLILSQENNAKSVVIMKPSLLNLRRFNLLIIPRHDNPPRLKNIVVTDGALNLIDKERMQHNSQRLVEKTGGLRGRAIGVLIGGATKDFSMDKDFIGLMLDNILKAAEEYDCDILLTTSRRTSADIEGLVKEKLRDEKRCKLLVIANESNIEGAVEGILGLSNISLVSQDSISMISEAASSGSHTLVFRQKGDGYKRHQAFLRNLSKDNFIDVVEAENTYQAISNFFKDRTQQKVLDDTSRIEEALERLL